MKKKRIILAIIAMLALNVQAFAEEVTLFRYESPNPFEYVTYFKTDFEGETGADGTAPKTLNDAEKPTAACSDVAAELRTSTDSDDREVLGNRYIKAGDSSDMRFNGVFKNTVSEGTLYIEFDARVDFTKTADYFTLGLLDTNWKAGKTAWFITLKGDGTITANGALGAAAVLREDTGSKITLTDKKWSHFNVEANIDNSAVVITVDGVKCKPIPMNFMPSVLPRAGLCSYRGKAQVYFDNFHVYSVIPLDNDNGKTIYFKDSFENDIIGAAPAGLKELSGDEITNEATVEEADGNKYVNLTASAKADFKSPVAQGRIVAEFDVAVGDSKLVIGFMTANASSNSVYTLKDGVVTGLSNGREMDIYENESNQRVGYNAGKWQHCRVMLDIDKAQGTIEIENNRSEVTDGISGFDGNPVSAITVVSDLGNVFLDNLVIYKHPNYVKSASFMALDGTESTDFTNVSTITDKIILKFADALDFADDTCIEMYNVTEGERTDITCNLSKGKNTLYIRPVLGYLTENCSYTLTVKKALQNEWHQEMNEDYVLEFTTGKSYITVFEMYFADADGNTVRNISAGDKVYLTVDYAKSGNDGSIEAALAYSAIKDGELADFHVENVVLDKFGKNLYKKEIVVPSDIAFDEINMFLWSTDTGLPVIDKVTIGGAK